MKYYGAGILPYDRRGIYVVLEEHKIKSKRIRHYTDFGGRCEKFDTSIHQTAIREFNEETYNLFHIEDVDFSQETEIRLRKGIYLSIPVHIQSLKRYIQTDKKFENGPWNLKSYKVKAKKDDPKGYYPTMAIHYITYEQIINDSLMYPLSSRLTAILELRG